MQNHRHHKHQASAQDLDVGDTAAASLSASITIRRGPKTSRNPIGLRAQGLRTTTPRDGVETAGAHV